MPVLGSRVALLTVAALGSFRSNRHEPNRTSHSVRYEADWCIALHFILISPVCSPSFPSGKAVNVLPVLTTLALLSTLGGVEIHKGPQLIPYIQLGMLVDID